MTVFALVYCAPVRAQSLTPGDIVVTVSDDKTAKPVNNAEVFLLGSGTSQSSLTDAAGKLTFQSVPPGIYRIAVQRSGYQRTEVVEFEVREGARVAVDVKLSTALKEIGSVNAHSTVAIDEESVRPESAERKLSQSLKDALSNMAGVSVDDSSYENSAFNISLRNHDPSQTGKSIDGVPVTGAGANALGAAQGLFTGATVNFNPTAGYLGGNVNFQTLQPTKTWNTNVIGTVGNRGAAAYSLSATGSKGRLSMAFQHALNAQDSPLSGMRYRDQSGRYFEHFAGNKSQAELVKFAYELSSRASVEASTIRVNASYDNLCNDYVTVEACGYGSVPESHNLYTQYSFSANSLIGNVQSTAYAGFQSGNYATNDSGRFLNGVPLPPYQVRGTFDGYYYGAYGSTTARRHTVSLGYYIDEEHQRVVQTFNGVPAAFAQPPTRQSQLQSEDKVKVNNKLALTHQLSIQSATGAGTALVLQESADWTPAKNDVFEGSVAVGSAQPSFETRGQITDPPDADYDCYNRSVFVNGPNDPAVKQSSVNYNFSWRHKVAGGTWNASIYRQNAFGQNLRAAVPIAADPASNFPAGLTAYLGAIGKFWASPTVCGTIPFNPQAVYDTHMISGEGQINAGFTISGQLRLSRNLMLFPTYGVGSTYLSTIDPRLASLGSYYAIGRQLPNRPLRTAGLILDGVVPKKHIEWLVGAHFSDVNNPNNLPAYTVFNAGLVITPKFGGTVTFVESNIFGTHTGLFSSYQGINPRQLVGGGSFAYSTTPLPPRQWSATWRIPWQQKVVPQPSAAPKPKT
ncbi:MAG: TonB-dependent receptor [Candidatus Eremiobacteraeota bacterium]|nr:TonB-dependent receptor [Candidatus Eremiobacteraeota bacterium]